MRQFTALILVSMFSLAGYAQDASQSSQVAAAAADAADALEREVFSAVVTPGVTVKGLLDRVGGSDELVRLVRSAPQIGGPRWLDDQTVQVRLFIDGPQVARMLDRLVDRNPGKSPVSASVIRRELSGWSSRTFSATGTSMGPGDIGRLGPPPQDRAWQGISDEARRSALNAARDSAINHVIESLRPIQFETDKNLDQALAVPEVNQTIHNWLWARPVKSVEFNDDLSIRVTLSSPPDDLWHVLRGAMEKQKQAAVPVGQAGWDWLEGQVVARAAPAVGIGFVQPPNVAAVPAQAALLPPQPPAWTMRQAQAQATAPSRGSNKLQTARAAEAMALEQLRREVNQLPLSEKATLGDAARRDPKIEEAISRVLGRARPFQVDYLAHGAVTVHMSVNLADLWAELSK